MQSKSLACELDELLRVNLEFSWLQTKTCTLVHIPGARTRRWGVMTEEST